MQCATFELMTNHDDINAANTLDQPDIVTIR